MVDFKIPNSDVVVQAEPGTWVSMDADGLIYIHMHEPTAGNFMWFLDEMIINASTCMPESYRDYNNWRRCKWQVPQEVRRGYWRTGECLRWVGATDAPGKIKIVGAIYVPGGGEWSAVRGQSYWNSSTFQGWEYLGETMPEDLT